MQMHEDSQHQTGFSSILEVTGPVSIGGGGVQAASSKQTHNSHSQSSDSTEILMWKEQRVMTVIPEVL